MLRIWVACLLLGGWSNAVAAEEVKPSPSDVQFVANVKFHSETAHGSQDIRTQIACLKGTPLIHELGGTIDEHVVPGLSWKPLNDMLGGRFDRMERHERTVYLDLCEVAGTQPTQYRAEFRLIEIKNGGKPTVLAKPTLVTVVGQPAKLTVGEAGKDRIEVEIVVNERAAVQHAAAQPAALGPPQTWRRASTSSPRTGL